MAKIEINGQIVTDTIGKLYDWFGIKSAYPSKLKSQLEEADGEDITLEINSPGGVVMSGYEMYNALKNYEGNIEAHVVYAASAATVVACAADKTLMSEAGIFMIHNCSTATEGNYKDHERATDALKQINEGIINVYEGKTGLDRDKLQELMDNETYMAPQRAMELGFVDGLIRNTEEIEAQDVNLMALVASASPIVSEEKAMEVLVALAKEKAPAQNVEKVKNEGGAKMTLAEAMKDPELAEEINQKIAEARNEGKDAERARMQALDAIAETVPADMMQAAKYGENIMDAKELAYEALLQGKQAAAAYMQAAVEDAKDTDQVGASMPQEEDVDESEALAGHVNSMKKEVK